MTDIATLAIKVESKGVSEAIDSLGKLSTAAKTAQTAQESLASSSDKIAQGNAKTAKAEQDAQTAVAKTATALAQKEIAESKAAIASNKATEISYRAVEAQNKAAAAHQKALKSTQDRLAAEQRFRAVEEANAAARKRDADLQLKRDEQLAAAQARRATAQNALEMSNQRMAASQAKANKTTDEAALAALAHEKALRQQRNQMLTVQYTVNDVAASLASGAHPMTILMQQGGQVTQAFGGLGETLKKLPAIIGDFVVSGLKNLAAALMTPVGATVALVAGLATLTYQFFQSENAAKQFYSTVQLTGGLVGATYGGMEVAIASFGEKNKKTMGDSRELFMGFANTGKYTMAQVEQLSQVTVNYAKLSGESLDNASKKFQDLADDPLKVAQSFKMLTAEQVDVIRNLEKTGDKAQATSKLLDMMNEAFAKGSKKAAEQADAEYSAFFRHIQSEFKDTIKFWGDVPEALMKFTGVKRTPIEEQLQNSVETANKLAATILRLKNVQYKSTSQIYDLAASERSLNIEKEKIATLRSQVALGEQKAAAQQKEAQANQAMKDLQEYNAKHEDKMEGNEKVRLKHAQDLLKTSLARLEVEINIDRAGKASVDTSGMDKAKAEAIKNRVDLYNLERASILKKTDAAKEEKKEQAQADAFYKKVTETRQKLNLTLEEETELGKPLNEYQKKANDLIVGLAENYRHLKAEKIQATAATVSELQAAGAQLEHDKERDKLMKSYMSSMDEQTKAMEKQADEALLQAENYGVTKSSLDALRKSRIQDTLESLKQSEAYQKNDQMALRLAADYERQIAALDKQSFSDRLVEDKKSQEKMREEARKTAEQAAKEWESATNKIADSITNGIVNGFEKGKNFVTSFRDMVVNMFKTMVLTPVIKATLLSAIGGGNAAAQALGGAGGTAGSTLGTLANIGSLVANVGGMAKNFITGGSLFANGASSLIEQGMAMQTALGDSIVGFGMGLQNGLAGIGTTLSEGFTALTTEGMAAGGAGMIGGAVASVAPYIAVAAAIYSYFSGKQGGDKRGGSGTSGVDATGKLVDLLGRDSFWGISPNQEDSLAKKIAVGTAQAFQSTLTALGGKSKGGATYFQAGFDADPQGTAQSRVTAVVTDTLGTALYKIQREIGRNADDIGKELGLESQRMIVAALTNADLPAEVATIIKQGVPNIASATQEAIQATLADAQFWNSTFIVAANSIKDVFGQAVSLSQFKELQTKGETLQQTFQRIGTVFEATNIVVKALGQNANDAFGVIGLASQQAREQLIMFAGGTDKLMQSANTYYQEFYTEAERTARATGSLQSQFAALGVQVPKTREEFRALVEAQGVSTEEGRKMTASLLNLAPAFAATVPALDSVGKSLADIKKEAETAQKGLVDKFAPTQTTEQAYSTVKDKFAGLADLDTILSTPANKLKEIVAGFASSLDAATPQGQAMIDMLDKLSPSISTVIAAAEEQAAKQKAIADEAAGLQKQLYEAQGNNVALMELERQAINPLNREMYDQVQAAKAAAKAAEDKKKAEADAADKAKKIADEAAGLQTKLLQAQGDTVKLREAELAALDPNNRALQKDIYALEDRKKALEDVNNMAKQIIGWDAAGAGKALYDAVFNANNAEEAGANFAAAFDESFRNSVLQNISNALTQMMFDDMIIPLFQGKLTMEMFTSSVEAMTTGLAKSIELLNSPEVQAALAGFKTVTTEMGKAVYTALPSSYVGRGVKSIKADTSSSQGNAAADAQKAANDRARLEVELLNAQGRAYEGLTLSRKLDIAAATDENNDLRLLIQKAQDVANTRKLDIDLLNAQGNAQEALRMTREDELKALSEGDKLIKQKIYAAQDEAATQKLTISLLELQGKSQEALAITRKNETMVLSKTDAAIQEQIYLQQDLAKAVERSNAGLDAYKTMLQATGRNADARALDVVMTGGKMNDTFGKLAGTLGVSSDALTQFLASEGLSLEDAAFKYWGVLNGAQQDAVTEASKAKSAYVSAIKAQFDAQQALVDKYAPMTKEQAYAKFKAIFPDAPTLDKILAGGSESIKKNIAAFAASLDTGTAQGRMFVDVLEQLAPAFDVGIAAADALKEKLNSNLDKALQGLQKSVEHEKEAAKERLDANVKALNEKKKLEDASYEASKAIMEAQSSAQQKIYEQQIDAANKQLDVAKESVSKLKSLFDGIKSSLDKVTGANAALTAVAKETAKAQLDQAIATAKAGGALPVMEEFGKVLESVSNIDANDFSSAVDYAREQLVTAGKLSELGGMTGGQLDKAQQQVDLLTATVEQLKTAKDDAKTASDNAMKQLEATHRDTIDKLDAQIEQEQLAYDEQIKRLDGLVKAAQDAVAIANGSFIALQSVEASTDILYNALAESFANTMPKAELAGELTKLHTEVQQLREDLKAQNFAIAANTQKTAKILSLWDGDGQPETRVV